MRWDLVHRVNGVTTVAFSGNTEILWVQVEAVLAGECSTLTSLQTLSGAVALYWASLSQAGD